MKIYTCQLVPCFYRITYTSFNFCSSGAIGARLSTDALNVKQLVGDNLALNVQTISTIIVGFTIAMVANWKLALIITVVVPLVGFQGYAQIKFLEGLNKNAKVYVMNFHFLQNLFLNTNKMINVHTHTRHMDHMFV